MVDLVKCGCGGTPSKPREVDKGDERRGYNFKAEITCTKCGIKVFGDSARDDLGWCNDTGQAIEDAVEKWNTALSNNCVAERDALKAEIEKANAKASKAQELADWHLSHRTLAESQLEAARKQEPCGYMCEDAGITTIYNAAKCTGDFSKHTPVYKSPVPAQQPEEVTPEYPMQPMFLDKGLPRFEKNPIVDWLCEKHGLNEIGIWWQVNNVEQKYIEQLYQLIGYSIRGYEELSNVSDTSFDKAKSMAEQLLKGGENER